MSDDTVLRNVFVVVEDATIPRHVVDVVRRVARARDRKVEEIHITLWKAHQSRFTTSLYREMNTLDRGRATELRRHSPALFAGGSGQVLVMHDVWYTRVRLSPWFMRRQKRSKRHMGGGSVVAIRECGVVQRHVDATRGTARL